MYFFQFPYSSELSTPVTFTAGKENVADINAYKPVKRRPNLEIKNNIIHPLIIGINYQDRYNYGTDNIYEKDTNKSQEVRARPNSEISIDFWYNENYNSGNPIKHLKSIKYTTDKRDKRFKLCNRLLEILINVWF